MLYKQTESSVAIKKKSVTSADFQNMDDLIPPSDDDEVNELRKGIESHQFHSDIMVEEEEPIPPIPPMPQPAELNHLRPSDMMSHHPSTPSRGFHPLATKADFSLNIPTIPSLDDSDDDVDRELLHQNINTNFFNDL